MKILHNQWWKNFQLAHHSQSSQRREETKMCKQEVPSDPSADGLETLFPGVSKVSLFRVERTYSSICLHVESSLPLSQLKKEIENECTSLCGSIISLLLSDCDFPRAVLYRSGKERRTRLLLFPFLKKLVLALTTSSNLPSSVDRSFCLIPPGRRYGNQCLGYLPLSIPTLCDFLS